MQNSSQGVDDKGRPLVGEQGGLSGARAQLEDILFKMSGWIVLARTLNRDGAGVNWVFESALRSLVEAGRRHAGGQGDCVEAKPG